jgi:hypothetical protein
LGSGVEELELEELEEVEELEEDVDETLLEDELETELEVDVDVELELDDDVLCASAVCATITIMASAAAAEKRMFFIRTGGENATGILGFFPKRSIILWAFRTAKARQTRL